MGRILKNKLSPLRVNFLLHHQACFSYCFLLYIIEHYSFFHYPLVACFRSSKEIVIKMRICGRYMGCDWSDTKIIRFCKEVEILYAMVSNRKSTLYWKFMVSCTVIYKYRRASYKVLLGRKKNHSCKAICSDQFLFHR